MALMLLFGAVADLSVAESAGQHEHTNRLIHASSPYLLQHAHNPVDWYEWGDEAFARAKRENKPIFLSIGYAACHWCHVMERESFENEGMAKILNEHFVCIKVDREERPDVDEIYMAATTALTGRGGWPMSVFMTPDGQPFECGTYFPLKRRGSRPGFRDLALEIAEQWSTDRPSLLENAGSLVRKVRSRKRSPSGKGSLIDRQTVSRLVDRLSQSFDTELGGRRSRRNKFPPSMAMEWMLREFAIQPEVSKPYLIEAVGVTLDRMARGGIYDHLAGGICRYSTDPRWFAPHFEKMLYDQATVSGVYLSAYQLLREERFARAARSILDYCLADLQSSSGGFYSSRDADSEGEEGKFYVWRKKEIEGVLGAEDAALFCDFYRVTARGNWHRGTNILHAEAPADEFARRKNMTADQRRQRLEAMQAKLLDVRSRRVAPGLDDKVLAEWNGLLITSLARGYRILNEPRYRAAAARAADFVLESMVVEGRLHRAHRQGKTHLPAYAADYANMIEALITLYETTFERKWLTAAERLNQRLIDHFYDHKNAGFFYIADDAEQLLVRSKNLRDGSVPSASSVAVLNLLRLAVLLDRPDLRALGEQTMQALNSMLSRGRLERLQWAVLWHLSEPKEIAIIGTPGGPATEALISAVYQRYLPNKVVALCTPDQVAGDGVLPLLKHKTLVNGAPAAYVCKNYACRRPVTKPEELAQLLFDDLSSSP